MTDAERDHSRAMPRDEFVGFLDQLRAATLTDDLLGSLASHSDDKTRAAAVSSTRPTSS